MKICANFVLILFLKTVFLQCHNVNSELICLSVLSPHQSFSNSSLHFLLYLSFCSPVFCVLWYSRACRVKCKFSLVVELLL